MAAISLPVPPGDSESVKEGSSTSARISSIIREVMGPFIVAWERNPGVMGSKYPEAAGVLIDSVMEGGHMGSIIPTAYAKVINFNEKDLWLSFMMAESSPASL
jgi:hypothetical protein